MTTADVRKTLNARMLADDAALDATLVRRRPNYTQQPSWFSGLRSRISQISMPEWLTQLGIGSSQHNENRELAASSSSSRNKSIESPSVSPCAPENTCSAEYVNDSYIFPSDCSTRSVMNFLDHSAVSLQHEQTDEKNSDWDWTLDTSLWNTERSYNDTLVMQHFGPLKHLITGCDHPGRGHNFLAMSVAHPTWCDKCGDFMWGFLTHAVKCERCNYTCHSKCRCLVTLDCKTAESSIKSNVDAMDVPTIYPDIQALRRASESAENLPGFPPVVEGLRESEGESFSGFIQIHMNFTRPINVVAGECLPSFLDVINSSGTATASSMRTITSFFLPRNTVKNVNISSDITTREMIVTLLRKFKVADNPRKFALYERICEDGGRDCSNFAGELLRVSDDAFPLRIARSWVELGIRRQFVLQENDTGDIVWDMFEIPELENFLRILVDEEKQYEFRIRQRYDAYRYYLNEYLRCRGCYSSEDESVAGVLPSAPELLKAEESSGTLGEGDRRGFESFENPQLITNDEYASIYV